MISIIIGTRPEIIKMAPVIRAFIKNGLKFELVHSNQHYTASMDLAFFGQLKLPSPQYTLRVGSGTQAEQTARVMIEFEKYLKQAEPDLVIVHGDTNTTLGASLAAKKLLIPVGHVEAGLRSRDETMPEEVNRILTDRLSTLLFVPTQEAKKNLLMEGIKKGIVVTGNTIVDALQQHIFLAMKHPFKLLDRLPLNSKGFILVTAHRPSNVDNPKSLRRLVKFLEKLSRHFKIRVIWPLHPRTRLNLEKFGIKTTNNIYTIKPVNYLEMLRLMQKAFVIATDSGGIQEEAFLLKRPLITLRENTERPETLSANFLVGLDVAKAIAGMKKFQQKKVKWNNKLGDGRAAEKIATAVKKYLKKT